MRALWLLGVTLCSLCHASGFSGSGFITFKFSQPNYLLPQLWIAPNGELVTMATAGKLPGFDGSPFLRRHLRSGLADSQFGQFGVAQLPLEGTAFGIGAIPLTDGRSYVWGWLRSGIEEDADLFALRLLSNGQVDPHFGDQGLARIDLNFGSQEIPTGAALDKDGRLWVVTSYSLEEVRKTLLVRLRDGVLDTSFGKGGWIEFPFPWSLAKLYPAPDGGFFACGTTAGPNSDFAVGRLLADGTTNSSFGQSGLRVFDFDGGSDSLNRCEFYDGKGYAFGVSTQNQKGRTAVLRFDPTTGLLDPSFADGGKLLVPALAPAAGSCFPTYSAWQLGHRIVLAERCSEASSGSVWISLSRHLMDGKLDTTFGTQGTTIFSHPVYRFAPYQIAIDSQLWVLGETYYTQQTREVALIRFTQDGNLDTP